MQLRRNVVLCDIFVVSGKLIARQAKRTYPQSSPSINGSRTISHALYKSPHFSAYAKGLSTALQGALQATGSYRRTGVSGFSFKGVYKAPIGTTSREASLGGISKVRGEAKKLTVPYESWGRYSS